MPSTLRDRVKRADQPLVLHGPAGRRLPLHILFVHSDAAEVESCVEELRRAHFKVSADIVVLTSDQFAGRLNSKYYDVVLAEYPSPNWQGPQALEILHLRDRQIPCIFRPTQCNRKSWRNSLRKALPIALEWITWGISQLPFVEPSTITIYGKSAIELKESCAIQKHATALL